MHAARAWPDICYSTDVDFVDMMRCYNPLHYAGIPKYSS
jgi:hypothetical protein